MLERKYDMDVSEHEGLTVEEEKMRRELNIRREQEISQIHQPAIGRKIFIPIVLINLLHLI